MGLTRVTTTVIEANALSAALLANGAIQARHLGPGVVGLIALTSAANAAAVHVDLTSNIDLIQDNVDVNISRLNSTNQNIASVISNATSLGNHANTNLDTKANVSATYFAALANDLVTYTQLNANIDVVHANANGITDDADVIFNVNKTFSQNVTIQGNLIVVGSQVDLGVGTATIDDNFIVVSSNLTGTPATDSGILINRGSEGNTFIGDHIAEDGIVFALSQSPHDNATISIQEYIDIHANAFHAASGLNFSRVHFGHKDDESTGIIADTTNNHIKFIIGGTEVANLASDANLVLNDGKITGSPNAAGERNSIDMDVDEEPSVVNSVGIFSVNSIFMGLDTNNNGDSTYFGIFNDTDDLSSVTRDTATFSVRDDGNVFVSHDINIEGNANVAGVNLLSNDYVTYTRLNANVNVLQDNVNVLQDNVNTVQDNVAAISGGGIIRVPFTNVNTAVGTSNVFFVGQDTADDANIVIVTLDGITQGNTEFVMNHSNNTIQFKDESIPSGTVVTIFSLV